MASDDGDDAVVLRSDTLGVVHIVPVYGSMQLAVCELWNRNLTNNRLYWDKSLPCDHPTCVRLRRAQRGSLP